VKAMALLGVPADYTEDDVHAAFRHEAKKAHPNVDRFSTPLRDLPGAKAANAASGR